MGELVGERLPFVAEGVGAAPREDHGHPGAGRLRDPRGVGRDEARLLGAQILPRGHHLNGDGGGARLRGDVVEAAEPLPLGVEKGGEIGRRTGGRSRGKRPRESHQGKSRENRPEPHDSGGLFTAGLVFAAALALFGGRGGFWTRKTTVPATRSWGIRRLGSFHRASSASPKDAGISR